MRKGSTLIELLVVIAIVL
ncbi:MAG: prepilin-type N-terminal cleavage/methylation domain-containing protein [Armatimonadetes bacterium]|nr:prepilin-type N-terminal cleavage/methylation domain-containing protein [Armatimonadota bacterium]